jgi:very-short-patch-repair endonuclease
MNSPLKGKTYEEIYGKENAEQQKIKRGLSIKKWHADVGFDDSTIEKMKNKLKQAWKDGVFSKKERSIKISNFMKNHNPMKNPEIAKKNADKRKGQIGMFGEKNPAFKGIFHKECLNCNSDISGPKWKIKNQKFCSPNCRYIYYSGEKHPSKRPEVKEKQRKARLKQINELGGDLQLGKNEKKILDSLENILGYKILRDFQIIGYKPDGYIEELNLIIEIDEKHHFTKEGKYNEKDIERQKRIENALNCKFLRIRDNISIDNLK